MLKHLWQTHRLALLAFAVALCALGYFGVRTTSSMIYWMDPAHQNQPLAGWMTPRYIGQSYGLPRDMVMDALMMDQDAPPRRVSLSEISEQSGMSMDALQARIDAATAQMNAEREAAND